MPNRNDHIKYALGVQSLIEIFRSSRLSGDDRSWDIAGALLGATFGGVLPDLLEPASSPNHRQFAHGVLPAMAVAWFGRGEHQKGCDVLYAWANAAPRPGDLAVLFNSQNETPRWLRFVIAGFFRAVPNGYATHLVADATTPRGLPLLGRLGA